MRSRISIALDEQGSPAIKVEYINSDDVRDDLVKRFIEGFQHTGNIAHVKFNEVHWRDLPQGESTKTTLLVTPSAEIFTQIG